MPFIHAIISAHSYVKNKVILWIRKSSQNHNDLYRKKMRSKEIMPHTKVGEFHLWSIYNHSNLIPPKTRRLKTVNVELIDHWDLDHCPSR